MNATSTANLIVDQTALWGAAALVVLTATIGVAIALLIFRFGWKKLVVASGGYENDRVMKKANNALRKSKGILRF